MQAIEQAEAWRALFLQCTLCAIAFAQYLGATMLKITIVILGFLAAIGVSSSAYASDFCDGYKAGYQQGYCYQEFACLKPLAPLCPLPGLGENDFQGGYNRGFLEGLAAKR